MNLSNINEWHRIWSSRKSKSCVDGSVLQRLISADGFDTPLGVMTEVDWRNYIKTFSIRANIVKGESIFEVGCGAGAFLFPYWEENFAVGGIDYSEELIQLACAAMPSKKSQFDTREASDCSVSPSADIVIANHVFHYFSSLEYSGVVLDLMLRKARRVVAICGIPDEELKVESEIARRGLLTSDEYERKYRGLQITYYSRQWYSERASRHGFNVSFLPHAMPGFAQNLFRYDCLFTKA
jgi:SAM-dependent methyltransferase